ncbi:14362_t:CDS:2 [Funneliformis caledonium]|uniref:14362_t:CDS:1 n=2 Tax=Funneliformis TaxID=1117308 RepID=A0A9N9EZV2_9GLOM|nr:14362_t:CDS:2 [Funneliformis caledonium]
MSLIKKIKSQYEMWKVTKYTRRRSAMTPDFEQKDPDFYKQNYVNGVYLNYASPEQPIPKRNSSNASFETMCQTTILIVSMVDIALDFADDYLFDDLYARFYPRVQTNYTFNANNVMPRENSYRQILSLFILTNFFAYFFYFFFSTLSYFAVFDKELMKHPKFLKNQIAKEIRLSAMGFPVTSLATVPWFFGKFLTSGSFINGAAHHALHHLYFNYNYGQYFTIWDKFGGSYRKPSDEQLDDKKRKDQNIWKKQSTEVDSFDENGKEKKS